MTPGDRARPGDKGSIDVVGERPGQCGMMSDRMRASLPEDDAVVFGRSKNLFSLAGACLIISVPDGRWLARADRPDRGRVCLVRSPERPG
jgi:hypothetical protein